ncbi:hydroxyacylglutathione hydrolase [Hyphomonas johnsonii]|uniref:Hydroxyacylglutathione hydrolase n=1 Tax=Hyphomonas johnsonii MHS-2 TaxID=1280950 RepID=A0A059FNP0_9PROT|nr:hydroxyacylglutathione hydrolase [Hyphomonas johnsonii]KCZ92264.1 putative hydroxyacylglutathione hydrolase [Hyphomonas johnsonii MHS-2]
MFQIHQFPCLNDNYGFLAHDSTSGETAAIDTPDAQKYLAEAAARGWTITQIWNTHWHPDHAGGNLAIKEATGCTITGPAGEAAKIPGLDRAVSTGDTASLGAITAHVIDVPGHTLGHIAYHVPSESIAFVGDAVFALGCGRVFEGDPEMMWDSLSRLKALPPETALYCAHEYTASNAKFAVTVDPGNAALAAYVNEIKDKRARNEWTVPTGLARELATNPFLRADDPALQAAMGHPGDPVATFAEIRGRKDRF